MFLGYNKCDDVEFLYKIETLYHDIIKKHGNAEDPYIRYDGGSTLIINSNFYKFYNDKLEIDNGPNILTINMTYKPDKVFYFIQEYGHWHQIPIGMEKYINVKQIVGNDIISWMFYDMEKNLVKHYFSKNEILY